MDDLAQHLRDLEEKLFEPSVRGSKSALEELLSPDFREIGASGVVWNFADIVSRLTGGEPEVTARSLEDFGLTVLSDGICLVTYRATRRLSTGAEIHSLRSSIWKLNGDGRWRMTFHQGTLLPDSQAREPT
jgi:hypothetical protein